MATLDNSPRSETFLRLEARKSFALGVFIADHHGRNLDIAGAELRLVVRKPNFPTSTETDTDALLEVVGEIFAPSTGYARFMLQASQLDLKPGEYEYTVALITEEGYSSVLFKGILELAQNTEYYSTTRDYTTAVHDSALQVLLSKQRTVEVRTGPSLAPGTTSFTDADKKKLDEIEAGAEVNVLSDWDAPDSSPQQILNKPLHLLLPIGGGAGAVLIKRSKNPGDSMWVAQPGAPSEGLLPGNDLFPSNDLFPETGNPLYRGGLDATGVGGGLVPTSDGNDSWDWAPFSGGVQSLNGETGNITLDADKIPDGEVKVQMTVAERNKLGNLQTSDIINFPAIGSAAALDETEVLKPEGVKASDVVQGVFIPARIPRIGALLGNTAGTADPTGGTDGDEYFQYTV